MSAQAISGRGGGGRGGEGEGGERGGEGPQHSFGSLGNHYMNGSVNPYRNIPERGSFSEHRPGVVTVQEEGGIIEGHDYDSDGTDRTERLRHSTEYPVFAGGRLIGWQSASEAQASESANARIRRTYAFALLGVLLAGSIALCWVAFK